MDNETLYKRVAQKLGIVGATDSVSAEDRALIESAYESVHAQLTERDLTSWSVDDTIPDQYTLPLVMMVASALVDDFGLDDPRRSQVLLEGALGASVTSLAERQFRKLTSLPGVEQTNEYF